MVPRGRLVAALLASAVAAPAQISFEAASVKPANQAASLGPLRGGPGTGSPGQLTGTASLKTLLMRAYALKDYQVNGPAWMDSARYEIVAKIPPGATRLEVAMMLQSLLAERFGLKAHRESRQLPMYALLTAKSGAKLKRCGPAEAGSDAADHTVFSPKIAKGADGLPEIAGGQSMPRSYEAVVAGTDGVLYKLWARRETMENLADELSARLGRPVVDRTGLPGAYDFTLAWTMETGGGIPRTGPPPDMIETRDSPILADAGVAIFTALPAQLGLRLEPRRGPVETLVVDKAERVPTEN